jgi:transcriptional regulator with XRE-family HTH domain
MDLIYNDKLNAILKATGWHKAKLARYLNVSDSSVSRWTMGTSGVRIIKHRTAIDGAYEHFVVKAQLDAPLKTFRAPKGADNGETPQPPQETVKTTDRTEEWAEAHKWLHEAVMKALDLPPGTYADHYLVTELRAALEHKSSSAEESDQLSADLDKLRFDYANDREHFELAFEGMKTHAENLESERAQLVEDFAVLNQRYRNQVASLAYLQEKLEEVQGAEQLQMESTAALCRLVAHYHDQGAER